MRVTKIAYLITSFYASQYSCEELPERELATSLRFLKPADTSKGSNSGDPNTKPIPQVRRYLKCDDDDEPDSGSGGKGNEGEQNKESGQEEAKRRKQKHKEHEKKKKEKREREKREREERERREREKKSKNQENQGQ
ncbi:unnamed protein product [Albugo candida]|uniref:Uncharacterized protein n=1 Tax=Albugo candida TaxID=65357 RepID=A0A024GLJ7_9STRA|nr:unnamed protein product [Albugo candida]|eukprot:CCI47753.1 unnamed protein product [Albugo candida]